MKKFTLICSTLFICATSHAMEHETELSRLTPTKKKNFQINCIQDIPKLSLKDIRPCFNIFPEHIRSKLLTTKNKNNIPLAETFTFFIALLEDQIKLDILTFMMDGDEISAELFYNSPFWYAQKRYHNAKQMIQKSSLTKQPVALLFRLPLDKQKEIMGIITPTFGAQLIGDKMIMINENTKIIIQEYDPEIQNNFFANEDIREAEYFTERCLNRKITLSSFLGGLTGGGIAAIICDAVSLSSSNFEYPLIIACSAFGGLWAGLFIGKPYCTYATKEKAPKIEI